jgi:hypothetical protein
MAIKHAFVGLPIADYAAAYGWYVRLLGRPADMLPHAREAVWRVTPNGSIYVVEDSERAGRGLVTLALDDLDAYESRLRDAGIAYTDQVEGAAPRRLMVKDVDGNALTFFQTPAQPGE